MNPKNLRILKKLSEKGNIINFLCTKNDFK